MSSPLIRFAARLTAAFTIIPSLLLAAPVINLTAPPLDSSTINHGMRLDFSVSDANPMTVRIFGDSSASPQGYLYIADNVSSSSLSYTWNAPVLAVETRTMGLWHFDDGAGTTAFDASANDNDGTLTNGPVWTTAGRLGYALDFDGTNDYVQIADDNSLDVSNTSGALTIEAWVYPHKSGDGAYHGILAKRSIGGANITNYQISLNSSNGNLLFYAGGSLVYISNTNIPANQWSHIAVSLSATEGKLRFYKNGVKTDSVTGAAFGAPNNEPLTIGMSWATTQCFDGLIDEVRLSNQVLSDTEIRNDYDLKINAYYWRVEAISGTDTTRSISRRFFIESPLNDLPVLDPIGARNTTENLPLAFTITSFDMESTPALTTANLPTGASFTDNGDGTGTFNWTPTFLQSGVHNVTFTATDDSSATDFEIVAITVAEAGNQLPVLASIGPRSTTENINLNFSVSASDIESIPSLSATGLPTGASFNDNGNGTGTFNWTPTYLQGGAVYNVTFTATDDSSATDFEIVAITVIEAGNQLPVLASIGPRSTTENVNLNFVISASDIESIPSLSATGLPTGASFNDNGNGTGTFNWTPTYLQGGAVYNVTFTATDDSSTTDFEIVAITVIEAGNQLPVLASIGPRSTTENINLNFSVSASDIESIPSLSATGLPTGASFTDNGNGTGTFNWTPTYLQSGVHNVTFTATDDSSTTDFEIVAITVIEAGNQLPVLASIGPRSTTENINLNFLISASDIESIPSLSATGLPTGASFTDNGNGTGTFNWTPTYLQGGAVYNVTFTTTDDSSATDFEIVAITVIDAGNQLPVLASIGPRSTTENINLNFLVSASDIESIPSLGASSLPSGATFTDNGNGTGTFNWTPTYLQGGAVYNVTFTGTDDSSATDFEIVAITVVEAGNQSPVLASIGPRSTTENINLNFSVSASDIESIPSLSASSLPSGATFNDNGNGTGTFDWTPGYYQSGIYNVTFTATDDSSATDFEIVTITVIDAGNRLPVLAPIGPHTGIEGVRVNFAVSASDLESTPSLSAAPLPSGAEFVDLGDGTGSFVWTPNYLQSGDHYITFTATDDSGGTDIEVVHIDIADGGNRLPVLVEIGNKAAVEGTNLNFSITASDIECTPVITGDPLPEGATLSARGYGTAVFDWTPGYLQSGNYEITFTATDDSGAVDVEEITISVTDAGNRQPVLAAIGPQSAAEGILFEMTISAADIEDIPSFSATPLPGGAFLSDLGNGTANFSWRPDFLASGQHQITFTAHDDSGATDYEVVTFGVADAGTVRAYLVPERDTVALDSTVIISLAYNSQTNSLQPLHGFVAKMVVNPSRVNILASARGDFLNDPVSQFAWQIIAPDTLRISDLRSTPGGSLGAGILATFTMRVLDGGDIPLHLAVFNPLDTAGTTMQTDKGDTVVTVDAVPPGMDPIVEPENQYYLDAPRFSYLEFNDNWALDAAYYQFDGYGPGQWEVIFDNAAGLSWNISDWTIPGFDQLEGEPHTVYFMVTDDAGNAYGRDGEIRWDFFKDETAPEIALLSPPHDSVSTEFAMRLAYDIFDNSPATIRLFGDRLQSAATLLMVSHLQAGDNSLEFNWGDMPLPAVTGETMGLWHFDENAGTTVTDVSENGNDGNFVGNPQWYEPGQFGYALNFDGVDDYLSIPDQASLDIEPVSGALTMEAWVYPHASGDGKYHAILAKRSMSPGTSTNYQISLNNTNGNLLFYNGTAVFISNTHIPVNQWSYVAVTLGAQEGRLRFYLNGIKMDSLNNVAFGAAHNDPLTIGVSFQISQCFDGLIDEIRLTRRILSEAEVAANFSMEAGIYYWRVEAEDGVNESQSEIRDFQIVTGPDTETPTVTVDWPPSGQTFNYLPVIQVHCRDNYNLDKAYYRFGICTSPFLFELWPNNSGRRDTTAILQVGAGTVGWNTLYFKVDDDAGLTNPDSCTYSWNYFYDNSGPRVDITYPPSGETSEILPQITLNYTADRGLNRAYYQIDNCQGEWLPIWDYNSAANDTGIVWMVPSVNPGYHELFFKVTDDAGIANGDSCVHNWTFTYQPEGVNLCVLGPTPGNTYTEAPVLDVCFYAADGIDRAYYMIDSCNGPWNEIWSYDCEVADTIIHMTLPSVPDGTHYVYLKIVDDFGLANADTCLVRWWYDWLDFICDCTPGETNNIPPINVLDIIRLIDFKFKAGPPPVPYTVCSGDADCNCAVNVLDIIKLIDYKFKNGSPPCDCETFVDHCGTPLE